MSMASSLTSKKLDLNSNEMSELDQKTQELRDRIADIILIDGTFQEDFYLYGFMKHTCIETLAKFNMDKAEAIVRESFEWRQEVNTDEAATKAFMNPTMEKGIKVYMDGKTKSGLLAWSANAGSYRYRELVRIVSYETVIYHWVQILSKAEKLLVQFSREVREKQKDEDIRLWPPNRQSLLILNCKDLPYLECVNKDAIRLGIALVKMASHKFAFTGLIFGYNAGPVMNIILNIIRPLVKGTAIDLEVHGCDEKVWKPALYKYVDPDQLRPLFGDTMTVAEDD